MKIWKIKTLSNKYRAFMLESNSNYKNIEENIDKGIKLTEWDLLNIKAYDNDKIGDNPPFLDIQQFC